MPDLERYHEKLFSEPADKKGWKGFTVAINFLGAVFNYRNIVTSDRKIVFLALLKFTQDKSRFCVV